MCMYESSRQKTVEIVETCKAKWDGRSVFQSMLLSQIQIKSMLFIGMIISLLCPQAGHSAEDGL